MAGLENSHRKSICDGKLLSSHWDCSVCEKERGGQGYMYIFIEINTHIVCVYFHIYIYLYRSKNIISGETNMNIFS